MAQTEQTTFLNFDQGLDAYTNPHRLNPTVLSVAVGVAVDRPGYAYPGPGYTPTAFPQVFTAVHSAFSYLALAQGHADGAVIWGIQIGTSTPLFSLWPQPNTLALNTVTPPVWPFRQQQSQLTSGNPVPYSGDVSVETPPQIATSQFYRITAWLTAGIVNCVFTHLTTGVSSGTFQLNDGGPVSLWSIAADADTFYFAGYLTSSGHGVFVNSYNLPNTITGSGNITLSGFTGASNVFAPGTLVGTLQLTGQPGGPEGSPSLVGLMYTNTVSNMSAVVLTPALTGTPVLIATNLTNPQWATISVGLVRDSTYQDLLVAEYFLFTYLSGTSTSTNSSTLHVVRTNNTLGAILNVTPSLGFFQTSITAGVTAPQRATASFVDGGNNTLSVVLELVPQSTMQPPGSSVQAYEPGILLFINSTFSAPATATQNVQTAWGGLALAGRSRLFQWAQQPVLSPQGTNNTTSQLVVLVPAKSGWRATGTAQAWGTTSTPGAEPAYPTGWLYDNNTNLVAKFGDSDFGSDVLDAAWSTYILPEASVVFGNISQQASITFCFPQYFDFQTIAEAVSGTNTTPPTLRADNGAIIGAKAGPAITTWTDANFLSPPAPAVQQGSTVTFTGALTAQFDGAEVTEAGWLMAAPTPIVNLTAGGTLPVSAIYQYLAVYVFRDANGKLTRSAPSFITTSAITTSGNQSNTVFVPNLFQTLRTAGNVNAIAGGTASAPIVSIEIYRNAPSQANNTTFYRLPVTITGPGGFTYNPITGPTYTSFYTASFVDSLLDANLINLLPLYTTGQAAGATSGTNNPLPFDCLANWNNATWGIARRNGTFELWFTWPQDNNLIRSESPTWNTNNRIPLPSTIGQPRALVPLDTQLIVLGSLSDCVVTGNGPVRSETYADNNAVYTIPTALPGSGGIENLNGATVIPQGILFQGQQGFTILDRGLNYTPIGNQVRLFTDKYAYQAFAFFPAMQAIGLYATTPPNSGIYPDLMYFYNQNLWGQIEHPNTAGNLLAGPVISTARLANSDGTFSLFPVTTDGTLVALGRYSQFISWRTGWLEFTAYTSAVGAMASMRPQANYGSVREVQVLMDCITETPVVTTFTLFVEYDYENNSATPPQTQTLTVTAQPGDTNFRFGLNASQCRRVRFTVTIDGAASTSNGSVPLFLITGLEVAYASDAGLSRLGTPNSSNF